MFSAAILRAVIVPAAGATLALAAITGAYTKGRVDGWTRAQVANATETAAALIAANEKFMQDLRANAADGEAFEQSARTIAREVESIRNELRNTPSAIVCPVDPDRARLLDSAVVVANAAIRDGYAGASGRDTVNAGGSDTEPADDQ